MSIENSVKSAAVKKRQKKSNINQEVGEEYIFSQALILRWKIYMCINGITNVFASIYNMKAQVT